MVFKQTTSTLLDKDKSLFENLFIGKECNCSYWPAFRSKYQCECWHRWSRVRRAHQAGMGVYLCVHACVSGLSVVTAVPVLHIHASLSLFPPLHLCVPLPLPLSPVHLSLLDSSHYCPGTSSACPAKARHGNGI